MQRIQEIPRAYLRGAAAAAVVLACLALAIPSLFRARGGAAELWTDNPGILIAAEVFNAAHKGNVITVRWKDRLAEALAETTAPPAIAIGSGLRTRALTGRFRDLGAFANPRSTAPRKTQGAQGAGSTPSTASGVPISRKTAAFYPALLEAGKEGGRQTLLPVSFDLDLLAFSRNTAEPPDALTLDLAGMMAEARAWDKRPAVSLPFSFRWDERFLADWLDAAGASFSEGTRESLLGWNKPNLDAALAELRIAGREFKGKVADEDDFAFKYLVAPLYRHAVEGRILFAPMRASEYFLLDANVRKSLDFRWVSPDDSLPAAPEAVYLGLPAKSTGGAAADTFTQWFFSAESQEKILAAMEETRASEGRFGIAGGFSALVEVTEKALAKRMPELLFRAPSPDAVRIGKPLPPGWTTLRKEVVGPWALRALLPGAAEDATAGDGADTLERALSEYAARNPDMIR